LIALIAGAATARPDVLPVMLVTAIAFIALSVTIERLTGSWLERLLARRRARELFIGLFVLSMISVQFVIQFVQRHEAGLRPMVERILPYLSFLPPSLAGRAVAGAALHDGAAILAGLAGVVAYIVIFTALLWQRFAAQYRGEELSETAAPRRIVKREAASAVETEDALSALSPAIAAVLRKEFRYLMRNGFTFISLL